MKKVFWKLAAISFFLIIYLMFRGTTYSNNWSATNIENLTSPSQPKRCQAPPEPTPPPSSAPQLQPPKSKEEPKDNEKPQQNETKD